MLTVSNFGEAPADGPQEPKPGEGGGFHTDVEYEPLPIAVSMFYVHAAPQVSAGATWVQDTGPGDTAAPGQRFFRQGRPSTEEMAGRGSGEAKVPAPPKALDGMPS